MGPTSPVVVIAGGGPAAVETALALRELAGANVRLELIAPEPELVLRAYEVMAPFCEGHEHRYPLSQIASDLDLDVIRARLTAVRPAERLVECDAGAPRAYDELVVAVGARHLDTVAGAIPYRGAQDASTLKALLAESQSGRHRRLAFIVPSGSTWPLPLYELALHTSAWLAERNVSGMPLTIVSPERAPLEGFGAAASQEVVALLDRHGVAFLSEHAVRLREGHLLLSGGGELEIDLAIALPRLRGPALPGLPGDEDGFIRVDARGRVEGVERCFAAGDASTFPIKQGGLATQLADVIAELVAAELGVRPGEPEPGHSPSPDFRPVLRAVLFAGAERRYLEAELGEALEQTSRVSATPLWPGSSKLVGGRHLGSYLDRLDENRHVSGVG